MDILNKVYGKYPDGYVFPKFTLKHYILLFTIFIIGFFIYYFRKEIRENEKYKKVIKHILIFLLIFQQLNFIYFYTFVKNTGVHESLPLYTCRFAIYTSLFALLTDNINLKSISVYLGLVGSFIAFLSPDLEPYAFPHILFFNYFLTHFLIFIVAMYYIFVEKYEFNKEGVIYTLKVLNIYLVFTLIINYVLKTNYAYLEKSPVITERLDTIPRIVYILLVFGIYNLSILITYNFCKNLKKRFKHSKYL